MSAVDGGTVWTIFVSVPDELLPFIEQRERPWTLLTDLLPLPGDQFALVVIYQVAAVQFRLVVPLQGSRTCAFVQDLMHQTLNIFFAEKPNAAGIGLRSRVEASFCETLEGLCRTSSTEDETLQQLVLASQLATTMAPSTTSTRLPTPEVLYVAAIHQGSLQKSGLSAALE